MNWKFWETSKEVSDKKNIDTYIMVRISADPKGRLGLMIPNSNNTRIFLDQLDNIPKMPVDDEYKAIGILYEAYKRKDKDKDK